MQKSLDLLFSKKSGYCFLKNLNCIDDSDGVQSTFFWGESIQQCRVGMLCVYLLAPDSARKLKKNLKILLLLYFVRPWDDVTGHLCTYLFSTTFLIQKLSDILVSRKLYIQNIASETFIPYFWKHWFLVVYVERYQILQWFKIASVWKRYKRRYFQITHLPK